MLSFTLALALASPCINPPAPTKHKRHKRRAVAPLICETLPAPAFLPVVEVLEPLAPIVVTRYIYAPVILAPQPAYIPQNTTAWDTWRPTYGFEPIYLGGNPRVTVNVTYDITNVTNVINVMTQMNEYFILPPNPPPVVDPPAPPKCHTREAPEIDPAGWVSGLTLLGFALAVARGRKLR